MVDDLLGQAEPGAVELLEDYVLGASILLTEWLAAIKRKRWIPLTIGERLILARKATGVSIDEWCDQAGINRGAYLRWRPVSCDVPRYKSSPLVTRRPWAAGRNGTGAFGYHKQGVRQPLPLPAPAVVQVRNRASACDSRPWRK